VHTRGAHLWNGGEHNFTTPTFVTPAGVAYWSNNLVPCENVVPSCRLNPNYTSIYLTSSYGASWYNALQVSVNKRLGSGLEFQGAYTYSRSEDITEGNIGGATCSVVGVDQSDNPQHLRSDIGPSCFDLTHNLRFNMLYHFPNIKSDSKLAKLANGWWMGNIVSAQGGYPFTPIISTNRSNSGVVQNSPNERTNVGTATVAPGQVGPDGTVNTTTKTFIPYNPNTVVTGNPAQWFNQFSPDGSLSEYTQPNMRPVGERGARYASRAGTRKLGLFPRQRHSIGLPRGEWQPAISPGSFQSPEPGELRLTQRRRVSREY